MDESNILDLQKLKKEYFKFKEKYSLPDFSELNRVFDIEDAYADSEFLLRKIRRVVSDKISGYLRFIEIILNPSNSPMFFFKLIKKLEEDDKKELTEIYERLGKFELDVVRLDLDYFESKEAEFINYVYKTFNEDVNKRLLDVVAKMGNGGGGGEKQEKGSYFG